MAQLRGNRAKTKAPSLRYEAAKTDKLHEVLDAVAWLSAPTVGEVAQFAGIDPRTGGKLLKNCVLIGLVDGINGAQFTLSRPYPHKGSPEQKRAVVREALVKHPLLETVRQFMQLGDTLDVSMRKTAAVHKVDNYSPSAFSPLLAWAREYDALAPGLGSEDLLEQAQQDKEKRHLSGEERQVVFLSHSSADKPFIRKLATDLIASGIDVWLDEQKIRVGDSIPEKIAQGLASSDFYLIAVSENSAASEWVKKELNNALVEEVSRRKVTILPLKLGPVELPAAIRDKKYADFTRSYKEGLQELVAAMKGGSG